MYAIYKKELRSSLFGVTGPVFIFAVLAIMGFFTAYYQFTAGYSQFEYTVIDGSFWTLLLAPILTMRSFTDERRTKTDQLLYSLPISTTQIVLGKYLALVTVFAIPCAVIAFYPAVMSLYTNTPPNLIYGYGALLGYFLLGCAVIALGTFISSLFESQVICAITNLSIILALYFMTGILTSVPTDAAFNLGFFIVLAILAAWIVYSATKSYIAAGIAGCALILAEIIVYLVKSDLYIGLATKVISYLFIFSPLSIFAYNTFDITCFIYYASVAAVLVFLTVQSFEKRRWD